MLDPWIIEEIIKRESEQRQERERPHVQLPLERPQFPDRPRSKEPESERGVVVIDI